MRPDFITYREPGVSGEHLEYYILQRAFPHYVGRLVAYPIEGALANAAITDHHLHITFDGCLLGNFILANKGELESIAEIFSQMAEWYYVNRIAVDLKKYKKWRII